MSDALKRPLFVVRSAKVFSDNDDDHRHVEVAKIPQRQARLPVDVIG